MDQGRSHASSIIPFLHRLKKDNHTIALQMASYMKEVDFGVEKRFIDMSQYENPFISKKFFDVAFGYEFTFYHQVIPFIFGSISCNRILKNKRERYFEILNEDWDLFFSDSLFSPCGYGMAELSGKHHVMAHSSDVESAHGTFKGFARNYAIMVPNFLSYSLLDFTVEKFSHRVLSTIDWFGGIFITGGLSSWAMKWSLYDVLPSFSFYDYVRTSTFSFTDMPDALYPVGPRTNDYFSFGAYCKPLTDSLEKDILNFIEDPSSKGTILVSFGTIIDWRHAPKDKINPLINVFNKLKEYRIIWSMKGERPTNLIGEHIKTSSWVSQNNLLHHNKTVLFFSHGGLKSVKEAGCSATPSIFMPMFGEQMRNAWLAKEKGFAKVLNKFELGEEILEEYIRDVIDHKSYQQNADKFYSIFLDHPISNLDEAAFKMNRLLKYNGKMPNLFYPKSLNLSYFTFLNIDLIIFIPFLITIILSK